VGGDGSKPDADHLTPAEAEAALRQLLDASVRESPLSSRRMECRAGRANCAAASGR